MTGSLAVVAIGRNEGARLIRCLESIRDCGLTGVYVDSGSTDTSVAAATPLGFAVVELDPAKPFTAARARHEGFQRLRELSPSTELVMFVDGDCEIAEGWPNAATVFLHEHKDVGVVGGRRRERRPEASAYNRLCDIEWDTPTGEALAIGGDFVVRADAYEQAGGFDASVPSGEEPEFCKRLRAAGWTIHRLDQEMTLHDADITHFRPWWTRQIRSGYGGWDVERRFRLGVFDRMLRSAMVWGVAYPFVSLVASMLAAWMFGAVGCVTVLFAAGLGWLVQSARIARHARRQGHSWLASLEYGWLTMLSKPAISWGVFKSIRTRAQNKPTGIIEYKSNASECASA
ncbi:Glycosyl transferase family 2 [Pseudobythopirellula maris]|uniref:Glycosyl transferase family 2 n=1 Tax=Pseudobythopirellula maris TaxID=2527991 RepID=A0A5C5ZJH4_9BACT|nr:glycosyltransferase [Pseudobythopirellula maris]TWT87509.1 Glycosyl transferase family 2 [Pseudobythopirellula maris]